MDETYKEIQAIDLADCAEVRAWVHELRAELPKLDYRRIAERLLSLLPVDPDLLMLVAHLLDEAGIDRPRLVRVMRANRRKIWAIEGNLLGRCFTAQAQSVEYAVLDLPRRGYHG